MPAWCDAGLVRSRFGGSSGLVRGLRFGGSFGLVRGLPGLVRAGLVRGPAWCGFPGLV